MYSNPNPNPHICQCLGHILTIRRHATVTIASSGTRYKSGEQFVNSLIDHTKDLEELGISNGDVIAIAALNRFFTPHVLVDYPASQPTTHWPHLTQFTYVL